MVSSASIKVPSGTSTPSISTISSFNLLTLSLCKFTTSFLCDDINFFTSIPSILGSFFCNPNPTLVITLTSSSAPLLSLTNFCIISYFSWVVKSSGSLPSGK